MRTLLLAALLLLTPLAAGQSVPGAPPYCGPITFGKVTAPTIEAGGTGKITVIVQNGNTFNNANVVVSATTSTPGWTVTGGDANIGALGAGSSHEASFQLAVDKSAKTDGTIGFSATATCQGPPGGVQCPANSCTATASTQGVATLQTGGQGFQLPDLNLGFPIEWVVLGVVIVAVAVAIAVVVGRKRPTFSADCPEPLKMVRPGRGTSFPIDIKNPGGEAMTAQFEVGPVPEGWSAFMPLPEVQLAPKETRSLWLMVRSPASANAGEIADVEVRLRHAQKPDASATVKVRAEVNPNAAEGAARPT